MEYLDKKITIRTSAAKDYQLVIHGDKCMAVAWCGWIAQHKCR